MTISHFILFMYNLFNPSPIEEYLDYFQFFIFIIYLFVSFNLLCFIICFIYSQVFVHMFDFS